MRKNNGRLLIPIWILSLLWACVTVNVYFPAKEVEKKAEDLVDEIRKKKLPLRENPSNPQSYLKQVYAGMLNQGSAFAAAESEVNSPAIQNVKNRLRDRFPKLIPYFQKGAIGEGKAGFLEIRLPNGLSAAEKTELNSLTNAENQDRQILYKEVANSMKIPLDQLEKVQRIFAEKWQGSADRGWWIQKEDGSWIRK